MEIKSAIHLQPDLKKARDVEDKKFRQASKLYEQQFIREMVKAMRSTVKPSGLVKQNFAEKIFREKLDEEYVQGWSNRGGVGLADMIYGQLKERFSNFNEPMVPPQGPLPVQQGADPTKVPTDKTEEKDFIMLDSPQLPHSSQFLFQGGPKGAEVTSPWSGKVSQVFATDDQRQVLQLDHDNGLRSKIVFEGALNSDLQGSRVSAGQTLGQSAGESSTVSWKVTKNG